MKLDITLSPNNDMFNLSSDDFEYGNIRGMYDGEHGASLQLSEQCEPARELIKSLCHALADSYYKGADDE